jgi:hypothetical protein
LDGYEGSLADLKGDYVQWVLSQSATFEEAAGNLGIDLTTLWCKRKRWGRPKLLSAAGSLRYGLQRRSVPATSRPVRRGGGFGTGSAGQTRLEPPPL